MENLAIETASKKYLVVFLENEFRKFITELSLKHPKSLITIITDENVFKFYEKELRFIDKQQFFLFTIKSGEKSKSVKSKLAIEKFLFSHKNNRQSVLVALGGGVVGDLVGYVAATFMRGIAYYMVPTSLLAMVDSSIGGKTGINNEFGKNLIGAFYQPEGVVIDFGFLKTLSNEHFKNGMAEVIKAGIIKNPQIFSLVEQNAPKLLKREGRDESNDDLLKQIIVKSIEVKREVVSLDERENNYRRILNFGHTVGHALELDSDYQMLHGFAVSIGMVVEAFFSYKLNLLPAEDLRKIIKVLQSMGLPYQLPKSVNAQKIYQIMLLDKKSLDRKVYCNLINQIGEVNANRGTFRRVIEPDFVHECFREMQKA